MKVIEVVDNKPVVIGNTAHEYEFGVAYIRFAGAEHRYPYTRIMDGDSAGEIGLIATQENAKHLPGWKHA